MRRLSVSGFSLAVGDILILDDPMPCQSAELDSSTRFIPIWVKVSVAIALGLGTMVGWKRIVVTVGEKIGKSHLTYGQGASAELVAAVTIAAADMYGLRVSTTHVLSSGVAGTMAANGSGLQWSTVRNMLMAWVLTLPVAMLLAGSLFWIFSKVSWAATSAEVPMNGSREARCPRILLPAVVLLGLAVACCGGSASGATAGNALPDPASLAGALTVDGSRTVLPVSTALAEAFQKQYPHVRVAVGGSDTGPGFERLCRGEIEISDASRPINAAELQACGSQGIQLVELPIAFDSLTVVVSRANTFAECLTIAELKRMWEPAADGQVTRWDQIRSGFPAKPIALFGPGAGSGMYDYFTLALVGANSSSRKDYNTSADLGLVVDDVAGDPNALGFLGFAYYSANKDRLKALGVDAGRGCVAPSAETVADATYQPLSRPLFIYVSKAALSRPEVKAFADFYVDPDALRLIREVGYVPLPPAILLSVGRRLDDETTGSVFGGRGSVLGVTAGTFQDEDRIKNALVR